MSSLFDLLKLGQSVWLDYIDRNLVENGGLSELVAHGVRGVTSNPTIFQNAITKSNDYDSTIRDLVQADQNINETSLYHWLTLQDVQAAADILANVYKTSNGQDGYVSLEVSPHLAHDTIATIDSAVHLWKEVKRPNLMIKVPATKEGIPAIETLIAEGINVNVTLLFSPKRYEEVLFAYLRGLQRNPDPKNVSSVASFFISRIDSKVDPLLDKIATPEANELKGKIAIANAMLVYNQFLEISKTREFHTQIQRGAHLQRPLWASTGVKNPKYSKLLYVEKLIGRNTVNTLPPATLDALLGNGELYSSMESDFACDQARKQLEQLNQFGIDLDNICNQLEKEGVNAFTNSYDQLLEVLKEKCFEVTQDFAGA